MSTLHIDFRAKSGNPAQWDREAAGTWAMYQKGVRLDLAIDYILAGMAHTEAQGYPAGFFDFPNLLRIGQALAKGQIK